MNASLSSNNIPVSPMYPLRNNLKCAIDDIGESTGEMISNLEESLRFRNLLNVINKSTSFGSYAGAFKCFRLIIFFEYISDQRISYISVTCKWNSWGFG